MAERLQKVLSAHGAASRREAERMIMDGRIVVNGTVAALGQSVQPGLDDILVDGVPLGPESEPVYIMLNKPAGYITTVRDERGRKTVMDLVADVGKRVYPVGRLDLDSEGLLLMTNDGRFASIVAHPSGNKAKTYEVRVSGDALAALPELRGPMEIDSHTVRAASAEVIRRAGDETLLRLSVFEGRNRQIRKMCDHCGLIVRSLKRVSIGPLDLGALEPGHWRRLTDNEVHMLMMPR